MADEKKKFKFRLLAGHHCEGKKDPATNQLIRHKQGDVFESEIELDRKFNRPGCIKFERITGDVPVTVPSTPSQENKAGNGYSKEELESLTVNELKKLAEEDSIDLTGASTKDQIIARFLA